MESTIRKTAVLLMLLLCLTSLHAGSTKMVSSWVAPDAKGVKLHKFLALVVTRSVGTRRAAEDEMVSQLNNRGNNAQASYELLSEIELEDLASSKAKVVASGADGAVLLRLHNFKSSNKDQPTVRNNNSPDPSGNRIDTVSSEFTFFAPHPSPGELSYTELVVEIETLVYSLKDDKLLWRGVSRTKNPLGARVVVQEITEQAIKTMKKQGLVDK
jgi:hypothetical protein